jgi:hypothetical protein
MDIKVFYAWQDDRPGKVNRYLIRDAAQEACNQINEDQSNEYNLSFDESTIGVPGMCDIPNTILKKIKDCDIFLADLTFVGRSDNKSDGERLQLISNPNVIIELGYDVGSKADEASDGFERVIAVMNTAYGPPDEQMFDIKRRHPMIYDLPEDSDKAAIEHAKILLIEDFKDALITIIQQTAFPEINKTAIERFNEIRAQFESALKEGKFHGLLHQPGMIAITIVPINNLKLKYVDIAKRNFSPFDYSKWTHQEPSGKSVLYVWETPKSNDSISERLSITEVNLEGVILSVDAFFIMKNSESEGGNIYIPNIVDFGNRIVKSIHGYLDEMHQMGINSPWVLGISLLEVRGCKMPCQKQISWERYGIRNLINKNDVIADYVEIQNISQVDTPQKTGCYLKETFDYIWREFGFPHSLNHDKTGNWISSA